MSVTNRDEWEFEYSAAELATASSAKRNHHESRLAYWKTQYQSVMDEVRGAGIQVNVSAGHRGGSSAHFGPQVMVRNDLQVKLTECHEKIEAHSGRIGQYDGWRQMLSSLPPTHRLKLKHADWLFFFGG